MTKTKFILYLILFLVVMIFVIMEIVIRTSETKNDPPPPEISEYELERMREQPASEEIVDFEETGELVEEEPALDFAEFEPQFPGGESAMVEFIQDNVEYPEFSREMGEEGTVYVSFIVDTDGDVESVKVLKGVSEHLDREAMRVVKKMPDWIPGKQDGEEVRCRFTLPISFKIQ